METFSIGYALLAVQSALLGAVTPELRAVVVDVCKEDELLYLHFYYDGKVDEKMIDLWECAITEASADLGPDCVLDAGVSRLDYPEEIPFRGRYAYLRRETSLPANPNFSVASTNVVREMVDFKERIGFFVSPVSGEKVPTNWGVIHYAKDGCHIVPAKPDDYKIEIFPLAYALLAIQRALLGIVTPELRTVIADIGKEDKLLYIRFYYDGNVASEILDGWECAITETVADLGPGYLLDGRVEKLSHPKAINFRGRYAYLSEIQRSALINAD